MTITPKTSIAELIEANPMALDAIISLSPKFNKLRNPILRKMMAPRASIQMASKIGGCSMEEFFNILKPLGFQITKKLVVAPELVEEKTNAKDFDSIFSQFGDRIRTCDVRKMEMPGPMIAILEEADKLLENEALFVFHKRIPVFLLPELQQKGYDYRIKEVAEEEVHLLIFHKQ